MHASDAEARPAEPGEDEVAVSSRASAFYVVYVGVVVLVFAYLGTVRFAENRLDAHFQERVEAAIEVRSFERPVIHQMEERIDAAVEQSPWVRIGGLRVTTIVLAQDGFTWLYVAGRSAPVDPERMAPTDLLSDWVDYLPARAQVTATLPHSALLSNAILGGYASLFFGVVYVAHRRATRRESERLERALQIRDEAARRTRDIASELDKTRSRLSQVEPIEREHGEEIEALQAERQSLRQKLGELAAREESLRNRADRALELAQEVRALEDLLEEATGDLESKDEEISQLKHAVKTSARGAKSGNARTRAAEQLARRFRTLYKTVEVDDRAISDIASLGDESLRLKAEESIKRLADEAENVSVRRKVGGLPDHVQVYELGFAGKGRIYYARGRTRRFRILLVGAKNTQQTDLEYLARLPRDDFQ